MKFLYSILFAGFIAVVLSEIEPVYGTIEKFKNGKYAIKGGKNTTALAWGRFDNAIKSTGWNYLVIHTNQNYANEDQAYAAGLLEGYLTRNQIYNHILNQNYEKEPRPKVQKYFEENAKWDEEQQKSGENKIYWHHKALLDRQVQGIIDGYMRTSEGELLNVTEWQIKVLTYEYDVWDLNIVLPELNSTERKCYLEDESKKHLDHCSALLKVLPNYEDIFVSHVTWAGAESMYRVWKVYDMPLHYDPEDISSIIPGYKMSMSSYPGRFTSGDDFYQTSAGLVIQETTDAIWDEDLNKNINPHTVYQWARNTLANRLAKSSKEWIDIFSQYQSGTYNNQWMVFDMNKFKPNEGIDDEAFFIYESIPGDFRYEDKTNTLRESSYWPSYNIPAIPYIYNISGYPAKVEELGILYDYTETPRAQIFKRDHTNITDVHGMQYMMRYNDFKHDPLSVCDCNPPYTSQYTISSRSDLNDMNGTYPFPALAFRNHMGTDVKMTSYKMMKDDFASLIISGPTYQNQPVFSFSNSPFKDLPHKDMPDVYDFSWYYTQITTNDTFSYRKFD